MGAVGMVAVEAAVAKSSGEQVEKTLNAWRVQMQTDPSRFRKPRGSNDMTKCLSLRIDSGTHWSTSGFRKVMARINS